MTELLVDTDVLVEHLRGSRRFEPGEDRILVSAISRAELFAGAAEQREAVRTLLAPFEQVPVDTTVAELGGAIRRAASIPLPDALIAASALHAGVGVLTANTRHFERVDGLAVRAPS